MKLLKKLDAIRRQTNTLSRAAWLRSAGVAESSWYRWVAGKNSPTIDLLDRLAREIDAEFTAIWTPPMNWKGPKQKGLRTK